MQIKMKGCVWHSIGLISPYTHILSGMTIERAIRGHYFIDAKLNAMLFSRA